jgi:phosphatidylethanolamine-binding protein (PEBP) family uncharacterized protein
MRDANHCKRSLTAGGAMLAACCISSATYAAAPAAPEGPPFVLTSTTFKDGGMIPKRAAFKANAEFPFCFGENVSPQLAWVNPRPGVKSYALTMFELEGGPAHTDLVVYGIAANVSSFAEGELSKPSAKFVSGKALRTPGTWRGMCPPPNVGNAAHHYEFRVRGTDLDPKDLPPGLTAEELDARLKDHTKGQALLVGLFVRPE